MTSAKLTFKANGDIVSTNANTFWESVSKILEDLRQSEILELDLRSSRLVDSVGLNAIIKIIKVADEKGGRIRLLIGSESLRRICVFTRLNQKADIVGP